MEKVRYMISDAATMVNVESHVLRYWEEELELAIPRNEMGHRYYTKENIDDFMKIKDLKEKGYQLKAIRMIIHNGDSEYLMPEYVKEQASEELLAGCEKMFGMGSGAYERPQLVYQGSLTMPSQTDEKNILDNTDRMAQFTELMTEIVEKAIESNNEMLSKKISEEVEEQVIKELNYLMREREEAEEERFRKLDEAIRGNLKKKKLFSGVGKKKSHEN